jgi:hypothetical protein
VTTGTAGPLVVTPTVGEPLAIDPEGEQAGRQRLHSVLTRWAARTTATSRFDLGGVEQWEADHGQGSSDEG